MTLNNFWNIIELAWKDSPKLDKQRQQAIKNNDEDMLHELGLALEDEVLENYKKQLFQLDKVEFTSFIHHLEERMYHIDRAEIQEYTDGSDDGFLYCRCFIVGMGKAYYNMIDNDPSKAMADFEAELFGFSAYGFYGEKFGEEFERYTHHNMETCSNKDQWNM